ncbi:DUF2069 domain-containing protein [Ferrimonas gelatinilytica]|uniref:DUF2069 domain-containing protein n=1 Tax=Ferrimonas gelatinilytica TaxID=1255257 RepID=A0ABP9S1H6_9GAMM
MIALSPRTVRLRKLTLIGYLASLLLIPAWLLLWPGQPGYSWLFQLLLLIPLLLPAYGIHKGRPYTHAWSGFIAALYLLWALTGWWVYPEQRWIATLIIASLSLWLVAATYFARHRVRELGLSMKGLKPN